MSGLDASSVGDDDIWAIKRGLAKLIDGVNASDIWGVAVSDSSTRRGRYAARRRHHRRRRSLLSTAATVTFTVSVSLGDTDYADVSDLLAALK